MHQALESDKVLYNIFAHLGASDLLSASVTCKPFTQIATDALWRTEASLSALVQLLPDDLVQLNIVVPHRPASPASLVALWVAREEESRELQRDTAQRRPEISGSHTSLSTRDANQVFTQAVEDHEMIIKPLALSTSGEHSHKPSAVLPDTENPIEEVSPAAARSDDPDTQPVNADEPSIDLDAPAPGEVFIDPWLETIQDDRIGGPIPAPPRNVGVTLRRLAEADDFVAFYARSRSLKKIQYSFYDRQALDAIEDITDQYPEFDPFPALDDLVWRSFRVPRAGFYHSPRYLLARVSQVTIIPCARRFAVERWFGGILDEGTRVKRVTIDPVDGGVWSPFRLGKLLAAEGSAIESVAFPYTPQTPLWAKLSDMPHLVELEIFYSKKPHITALSAGKEISPRVFSTLKRLTISCSLDRILPLLEHSAFPTLETVIYTARTVKHTHKSSSLPSSPHGPTIASEFLAVLGRNAPALRSLTLLDFPCIFLTGRHLLSLQFCTHLQHFHLGLFGGTLILDDPTLAKMASAWPSLIHLFLDPDSSPTSRVTLPGLVPFAKFCPRLEYLALGLEVNRVHIVFAPEIYKVVGAKVQYLNVGSPLVHDTLAAAEFIKGIFPSVTSVFTPLSLQAPYEGGRIFAWNKVVKLVQLSGEQVLREVVEGELRDKKKLEEEIMDDDDDYLLDDDDEADSIDEDE